MLLRSEVTNVEYEIKTYAMDGGVRGFCHESMQDILENQLGEDVSYNIEILAATENYCAAKCTITDGNNRKIQCFNDVSTSALESREESQQKFAKAHPLIAAVQSAVDGAVKSYLKWPRVLPADSYAGTSVITDEAVNIPDEEDYAANADTVTESVAETEANHENSEIAADEQEEFGMNPPEYDDSAESDKAGRLAELGKKKAPARSKYKDMTYDEIWESNQSWFSYIKNNNRSKTYEEAREYAELKEAEEKGQL